jgi:hypothetical protein
MPTAYVFMNCNSGAEERIIQEIADLSEVKEVRGIYAIYDIFVKVNPKIFYLSSLMGHFSSFSCPSGIVLG